MKMKNWAASQNRAELPSLAAQDAFLRGDGGWSAPVRQAPPVVYGPDVEWFAVRTNPRCEDRAITTLGRKGFETFLPKGTAQIVHHRTRKVTERQYPLLVGYIFLAMPMEPGNRHWGLVRECDGVKGVLGAESGAPRALPRMEVEALRIAEQEDRLRVAAQRRRGAMVPHSFVAGEEVKIAFGPFSGLVGRVVDAASRKAIRVLLNVFGGLTAVDVPVDVCEAAV